MKNVEVDCMGDSSWNNISHSFKDSLLELALLELIREKPDCCAGLVERLPKKTNLWLPLGEANILLVRLTNHGMLKTVPVGSRFRRVYTLTVHGKEEIVDRVQQMKRFIKYVETQK
jgi:DNA-binding PadR family transcriptional regulator